MMPKVVPKVSLMGTKILVRRKEAEAQTKGGIIIPEKAKEKPLQGTLIAIGPDVTYAGVPIEIGSEVLFDFWAGTEVVLEGNQYLVMDEADVLLVFKK